MKMAVKLSKIKIVIVFLAAVCSCISAEDPPNLLQTVADYAQYAKDHLSPTAWDYYSSGAMEEQTLNDNTKAFERYRILTRQMGKDVNKRSLETTVLGYKVPFPIGISPSALHGFAHPTAENGTAMGAKTMNTIMFVSSFSSNSMEEIAAASTDGVKFFQLIMFKNNTANLRLIRRAESAGYKAISITLDQPLLGKRLVHTTDGTAILDSDLKPGNFKDPQLANFDLNNRTFYEYADQLFLKNTNLDTFKWLKSVTKLPLVAKGVLSVEDAVALTKTGVSAIVVSNHGGRQLDGVPATIDVLEDIVKAVGNKVEVYMDSGVRKGTDVMKALALGARFVLVGRPAIWGLAQNGANGVADVLSLLRDELDLSMALAGKNCLKSLDGSMLRREIRYPSEVSCSCKLF